MYKFISHFSIKFFRVKCEMKRGREVMTVMNVLISASHLVLLRYWNQRSFLLSYLGGHVFNS
jgi:hypothetical protein